MKFKMSEQSLFAILLRSPWWISLALAVGFALLARALLPAEYFVFGVMGGFPFIVIAVRKADDGAHISEALADAMSDTINLPSPDRYSTFAFAKFKK